MTKNWKLISSISVIDRSNNHLVNADRDADQFNRELSRWRVTIEHVFGQLKSFKILRGIFPLQAKRYGTCFKAIATIYNLNLAMKSPAKHE